MKPRLLDLFCGAGGASAGYARAGFDVVGVDIVEQPHYPFEFIQADALEFLREHATSVVEFFDALHASPPCQHYSLSQRIRANDHDDLIAPTRELLEGTGLPYVIENVKRAPLVDPIVLEGQMFEELRTHRPRYFETSWPLDVDFMRLSPPRSAMMGRHANGDEWPNLVGHFPDVADARRAMGIDWMTRDELREAIPPAYSELIGTQLLEQLTNTKEGVMATNVDARRESVRLLSVTSIISKGLGKNEGLLYWAAGEAAKCALDDRVVVDAMIQSGQPRDDVWKWIRDARMRTMKRAQARGTQLHFAAEQLAKGVEPTLEPEVEPYFEQFRRWLETWNPKTLMAEATVYNPSEQYAGTLDGIVELSGRKLLYDIKTTAHGPEKASRPPFPEVALQLAAYAHATHVGILPPQREEIRQQRWYDFDPSATYEQMPSVDAALCVVVSPHDCFAKVVEIGEDTWAAFKFVREIARWNHTWVDSGSLFGAELLAKREKAA